jgi:hypothetical protein
MEASAAVRGLFRIPRAGPAFRRIEPGEEDAPRCGWNTRVESIRNILSQSGYTVTQLSAATRRRYGIRSPYFIPATFLYQLKSGVTPHICQVVALSESTGYRFVDWLRMCGFDLRHIPRLQMRLHPERTVLVTPAEDGIESLLRKPALSYDVDWNSPGGSRLEWGSGDRRYLFAKIGARDALVYPGLLPGSIVRIDRAYAHRIRGLDQVSTGHLLWLVEQPTGLTCSRVRWIDDRQIVLLPTRPPWGSWPLRLPTEARILGVVDTDLRLLKRIQPQPRAVAMYPGQLFPLHCSPLHYREDRMKFSELLRVSRGRTGLTFRAAHRLTRTIALLLGNHDYGIALGLLSDYEAMGKLPRHIAKILSLCIIYCMDILELMESAGVRVDDSAKLSLPTPDGIVPFHSDFLSRAAHAGAAIS